MHQWSYDDVGNRVQQVVTPYGQPQIVNDYNYFQISQSKNSQLLQSDGVYIPYYDSLLYISSIGWAEMIRKVYEINPLLCPSCVFQMRISSFIEEPKTIERNHDFISENDQIFRTGLFPCPNAKTV